MATEDLVPTSLIVQTNLSGTVADIDDDPDAPDAAWLTAVDNTANTILRCAMADPSTTLTAAVDQTIEVYVRRNASTSGTGSPDILVELYESGSDTGVDLVATTAVSTDTGVKLSGTFTDADIAGDGSGVEVRILGTVGGGGPNRRVLDIGAVRWIAETGFPAQTISPTAITSTVAFGAPTVAIPPAFALAASANIPAGGNTATTFQLTAPAGKTTGNFTAGKISDDTNPVTAVDIGDGAYTELEWSVTATNDAQASAVYEFRVLEVDTVTVTATWTIGTGAQTINPTAVASTITLGSPTVTPGPVGITATAVGSTGALGAPSVAPGPVTITPTSVASTATLGAPTVAAGPVDIAPTSVASTVAIGSPTVTPGPVGITPTALGSTIAIGSPTLAPSTTITPTAVASTATLGAPTVTAGPVGITPTAIASTVTFGAATVGSGATITPTAIASTVTIGSPTVAAGPVGITATALASTAAIGAPTVTPGPVVITPTAVGSTVAIGAPSVASTATITPTTIASTVTLGTPTVAPGPVTITPTAVASSVGFGAPAVGDISHPATVALPASAGPGGTGLGKLGPWFRSSDGNAYVFALTTDADTQIRVFRGTDEGRGTWTSITPWDVGTDYGWAEVDEIYTFQVGDTVHVVGCYNQQASPWNLGVAYRSYNLATEAWNADAHEIEDIGVNTLEWEGSASATLVVRSNGDIHVIYHRGAGDRAVWWTWYDLSLTTWSTPALIAGTSGDDTIRPSIVSDEIILTLRSGSSAVAYRMAAGSETWTSLGALNADNNLDRNRTSLGFPGFVVGSDRHHVHANIVSGALGTDRVVNGANTDTYRTAGIQDTLTGFAAAPAVAVGSTGARDRVWLVWRTTTSEVAFTATDQAGTEAWDTPIVHDWGVSDLWTVNAHVHTRSDGSSWLAMVHQQGTALRFSEVEITEIPTQDIAPTAVASTLTIGAPTITPGPVAITATAVASTVTLGAPTVTPGPVGIAPTAIGSTGALGTPTVTAGTVAITPTAIGSTVTIGSPTVTPGPVIITATSVASTVALGAPTVTGQAAGQTITPTAVASTVTLGSPTVTPGPVTITATAVASSVTLGAPVVGSGVVIAPTALASTVSLGTPTLAPGPVTITPIAVASSVGFGAPTVTPGPVGIAPTSVGSTVTFGAPAVEVLSGITPTAIASTVSLGTPTLAPGPVTITPTAVASTVTFGSPTVAPGGLTITPTAIGSTVTIGASTANPGTYTITPTAIGSTVTVQGGVAAPSGTVIIQPAALIGAIIIGAVAVNHVRRASVAHTGREPANALTGHEPERTLSGNEPDT